MKHLIEMIDISKIYGTTPENQVRALDDLSVSINYSEFVAIMGPSGSGKSTLMNIIGCLDRPTSGKYLLEGSEVSSMTTNQLADLRNQKIGFVFQSFHLLQKLTALDNVLLPMLYNNNDLSIDSQKELATRALGSVGLTDRMNHFPNQLSGGQQQRVAIARALINNPPLILADEPTGNLDSRSSKEIMELFHTLHDRGTTIVIVTHEDDIARHAERVICVRDGKVTPGRQCSEQEK